LTLATFPDHQSQQHRRTEARVREGDLDTVVYYALQSTSFTAAAPIEPALSARAFVERLDEDRRRRFLSGDVSAAGGVPDPVRQRLDALIVALPKAAPRTRLWYIRDIVRKEARSESQQRAFLAGEYMRAMRFLYEKEFVAQRSGGAEAVAALYRERGLSTDTAVEAGYLVHLGLATLKALEPGRRVRRVLIVGPGLDLAPRTGLMEAGPPESYQPYSIVDSLLALGLADLDDLAVLGADVNARVVSHLDTAAKRDVSLMLVTGVGDSATVSLQEDFRQYFKSLGTSIGALVPGPDLPSRYYGHLRKALRVHRKVSQVLSAVRLDIASERIDSALFDLVVATNVLPYLNDTQLTMAIANLSAMLGPGGVLLHNEARPLVGDLTAETGLPLRQARTGVIATVRGAGPLADGVWIHEKVSAQIRRRTPNPERRTPNAYSPVLPLRSRAIRSTRSDGSAASNASSRSSPGCRKASRRACSACRPKGIARSEPGPNVYRRSPTRTWPRRRA
jgi:hypothetical protein